MVKGRGIIVKESVGIETGKLMVGGTGAPPRCSPERMSQDALGSCRLTIQLLPVQAAESSCLLSTPRLPGDSNMFISEDQTHACACVICTSDTAAQAQLLKSILASSSDSCSVYMLEVYDILCSSQHTHTHTQPVPCEHCGDVRN